MAGWIKCSDRLPGNGDYIVWHEQGWAGVLECCEGHWNCHKYCDGTFYNEHEITSVIAWQPIEPFNEERSEDER